MPVISTNTAANTALTFLNKNSAMQSKSLAKISSGSRIVTASDDAAGLAVGTQLSADVAVLKQAATNAQNGRAILQIADGGLGQVANILQRMKSIAAQAATGTVDATTRGYIDSEFQQLEAEINQIETSVTFNGDSLLDGGYNFTFLVGTEATNTVTVDLTAVNVDSTTLGLNDDDLTGATTANAETALTAVDTAIGTISGHRATVGSLASRFEFRGEVIANAIENTAAATSSIMDVDVAAEQTKLTNARVQTEAAIAGLAQANQMTSSLLTLLR
tara:strand:+ start:574 stop:1398 length:825 start_codon:yes stop_codon:yes gene_type:complete